MTIRILSKDLAEKIAAGEVVERPLSVIKELVENSIDAGATKISIELHDGGKVAIHITDNGSGIQESEMLVALERHATSKIQNLDDLWNLHTMGFRGEALPSIAAISRMTLESKATTGRTLYLEGGKLQRDESTPSGRIKSSTGTRISVEDLFFNVPARLKFLKSKTSENTAARDLVERLALCHPQIEFQLFLDSRKSLDLPKAKNAKERFADVLEVSASEIESFYSKFEDIEVEGFLDRNTRARNSNSIYLAVNDRMVRDRLLIQAITVALRPRMMEGEYPRVFLNLKIDPSEVDVNVHPAKSEVRFRRSKEVFQVVHGALEKIAKTPAQSAYAVQTAPSTRPVLPTPQPSFAMPTASLFESARAQYQQKPTYRPTPIVENRTFVENSTSGETHTSEVFSSLHYIGQLKNTYLLFQDEKGLTLIDQHAAHERINYEKIKSKLINDGLKPQPLLVSAVLKSNAEEIALALENEEIFSKLGFVYEAFGENAILIRECPQEVDSKLCLEFFKSILENLKDSPELATSPSTDPSRLSPLLERMLATTACHASVRAGQALSPREAQSLVSEMETTDSALNCPHGRPASIRLDYSQIEGLFKR